MWQRLNSKCSFIRKCVHCWLYYSENLPITEQKFFLCRKVPFNTDTLRMDHQDVVLSGPKYFFQDRFPFCLGSY